jgi:Protein of unknown function (DUF1587)./Protein of unknown function (DUF1592)./Protein of unknown function (DUF1595)./Protein of unknown function (DUF1588)./Protein of unknown function (DUF1585).
MNMRTSLLTKSRQGRPLRRNLCTESVRRALFAACGLALSHFTFANGGSLVEGEALLDKYCSGCHNDEQWAGGISLSFISADDLSQGLNNEEWEKILRKAGGGEMPPAGEPRPTKEELTKFTTWLESNLDSYAAAHPNPGRATLRRLNRTEYTNAVRELLAINVDIAKELPADDAGYGFDNIADVLTVSPALMDRYLAAASKVVNLALGLSSELPALTSYNVPKDGSVLNQGIPSYNERSNDALPFDSRGGGAFDYYAPYDGTYVISGYLNANTNNEVDRLPELRYSYSVPLAAGPHSIGMAFRKDLALDETVQTLHNNVDYVHMPTEAPVELALDFIVDGTRVGTQMVPSYYMSSRYSQQNWRRDVLQIDIEGPFDVAGASNLPGRNKVFTCTPAAVEAAEAACAQEILERFTRQAYRRPVTDEDIEPLLAIYAEERSVNGFERGVAAALQAVLVSPSFLFLVEQDPVDAAPGSVHPISDLEYASRLALFLWSSLPDEELLQLAEAGQLRKPEVLEAQVQRMLADPKADALTQNFAGQWLYLRNLEFTKPDVYLFPEFGTRLREAMRKESELFFSSLVRDNGSVLDFIDSDYTFLNEALAEHYGIEGVKGAAFRKVKLDPDSNRGGLLGQGSILTTTSYGNSTSVVRRGKWILENLLSSPPPPPPPDVPSLVASSNGRQLTMREQMEMHRSNPVCASCHSRIDPLGFALENFDPVGRYRSEDVGMPIDASGVLPDGSRFEGFTGVKKVLMEQKDIFVRAFAERLLTYALGRGVESHDQPTVRAIARAAAENDYKIQSLVMAILTSEPFNLRKTPEK